MNKSTLAMMAAGAILAHPGAALAKSDGPVKCYEDMRCWSWPKMGNHQRGVVNIEGHYLVVGPCRFRRMDERGRIDWAVTLRMKGDNWARKHGYGCACRHKPPIGSDPDEYLVPTVPPTPPQPDTGSDPNEPYVETVTPTPPPS